MLETVATPSAAALALQADSVCPLILLMTQACGQETCEGQHDRSMKAVNAKHMKLPCGCACH